MRTVRTVMALLAVLVMAACGNTPPASTSSTTTAPLTATAVSPVTVTAPATVIVIPTTIYPYYYNQELVTSLPRGLFCRDLKAMNYSWSDAILYWNSWGRPANMDADLNGIPCETVY